MFDGLSIPGVFGFVEEADPDILISLPHQTPDIPQKCDIVFISSLLFNKVAQRLSFRLIK